MLIVLITILELTTRNPFIKNETQHYMHAFLRDMYLNNRGAKH
jgi:hypothetical protein